MTFLHQVRTWFVMGQNKRPNPKTGKQEVFFIHTSNQFCCSCIFHGISRLVIINEIKQLFTRIFVYILCREGNWTAHKYKIQYLPRWWQEWAARENGCWWASTHWPDGCGQCYAHECAGRRTHPHPWSGNTMSYTWYIFVPWCGYRRWWGIRRHSWGGFQSRSIW